MPGKHHLRGFKIAKKIGSPLRGSWICDMCIDARKTSLTGVQNSKKNRLAATRLVDDAPPWKKARSAAGMWGKNVFFFVMLLPRGKILISSAKYWFLGMRILKSSNTTWQLWTVHVNVANILLVVWMHYCWDATCLYVVMKEKTWVTKPCKSQYIHSLQTSPLLASVWLCSHGLESRFERCFRTWTQSCFKSGFWNAKKKGVLDRDPPRKPVSRTCEHKALSERDSCVSIFLMRAEVMHKRMGQSPRADCAVGAKYYLAVRRFWSWLGRRLQCMWTHIVQITIPITFWIVMRNVFRNVILAHVNTACDEWVD